ARLIIPAGAVKTDTAFSIKKLIKSEIPPTNIIDNTNGIHSTDVAYDFQPYGFKFQKPVVIEIPYTTADLAASGLDGSKDLKIYFYNTAHLAYEKIGGILSANKISAKVNDLSLYMLVNDQSRAEFDLTNIFVSPNPFSPNGNGWNDSTFINYTTTVDSNITIKIFDVRGVPVRRLMNGESVSGGNNKAEWDGRDDFGKIVKTGVYVYQLKSMSPARSTKTYQGTIVVSKNLKD
ncbi:MAG TPA: gliding motility-associated C-terminal domain-containing protein, partial [Candidatus Wallbacteria bacterium]|nr:gliding motility-associated C-terminal domain-containing protein [Candidatus Wallbacteria bacterium]